MGHAMPVIGAAEALPKLYPSSVQFTSLGEKVGDVES